MSDEHSSGRVPPDGMTEHRRFNTGPMVWGAVLGFIASWLMIALTYFEMFGIYGNLTNNRRDWLAVATPALPAIIAAALLVAPRTRYLGAGLLAGFAIGYILGAGVCVGVVTSA